MTNAIEQSKREMCGALELVKVLTAGGTPPSVCIELFEARLEAHLELLRQDHEALHETARKRFEDIQSLEAVNKKWQGIADNRGEHINHVTEQLAKMTEERDAYRNLHQASEFARDVQCGRVSTSGQTSGDRVSCATLDGKTAAILGAAVDIRKISGAWAMTGRRARKSMLKISGILARPEVYATLEEIGKSDSYAAWFIRNTNCMHSFHPAFPGGEQCVFCGVGK